MTTGNRRPVFDLMQQVLSRLKVKTLVIPFCWLFYKTFENFVCSADTLRISLMLRLHVACNLLVDSEDAPTIWNAERLETSFAWENIRAQSNHVVVEFHTAAAFVIPTPAILGNDNDGVVRAYL